MENKKSKTTELSKQTLENIKGGGDFGDYRCPTCGENKWNIEICNSYTRLTCTVCATVVEVPR